VYAAAGFLQRSWPDWRAYQYLGLARLAFATGHPYWGYRFLGWGVHHVQDLTQPYHAKPLPGVELPSLLLLEGKALAGFADDKKVQAIYTMVEDEIIEELNLWENEDFLKEMASRVQSFESGNEMGTSWEDVKAKAQNLVKF
jgi:hypothetical protein